MSERGFFCRPWVDFDGVSDRSLAAPENDHGGLTGANISEPKRLRHSAPAVAIRVTL